MVSPLDGIDAFVFFADAMGALQSAQPARYTALLAGCDAGSQQAIAGLVAYAGQQREKALAEAAAVAAKAAAAAS